MKKIIVSSVLLIIFEVIIVACGDGKVEGIRQKVKNIGEPNRVTVYCFGGFDRKKARALVSNLKEYYPDVELAEENIPLPADQYYKPRNRYKGTGLFKELHNRRDGNAIVGLTDYVIYQANDISPTYGIMGIAPVGKYICVVSNKIPKGGTQSDLTLCRLALHELGHSFGLPRCPDQRCYMVDAEHKFKLKKSDYFCPSCKKFLNNKGWHIK